MRTHKRTLIQLVTVGALLSATLVGFFYTNGLVQDDRHNRRAEAAEQLSLEIDSRIQKILAAEEGIYGLSNGQPNFDSEQFDPFGRELIPKFGLSYVGWAPVVSSTCRRSGSQSFAWRDCFTTWARSGSPTRSSRSRRSSRTRSSRL